MPKVHVYDPPMCCSTGVCGPEVDPGLAQFASDLEWLKENGVEVQRFNLGQEPAAFVGNPVVAAAIRGRDDALPLLLVDGAIAAQGSYPTREALARLAGVAFRVEPATDATRPGRCAPSAPGASATSKKCC
jgi:hypothetical protein